MSEPISGTAAGVASWKVIGGLAGVAGIGSALATVVVMCLTEPRNRKEWAVCLIATIMASFGGGAFVVVHYGLQDWAQSVFGMMALLGLCFSCGLPGWVILRAFFNYSEKNRAKGLDEMVKDVKGMLP